MEAFSAKLRDEMNLEALNHELVGMVRWTSQPDRIPLWLRPNPPPEGKVQEQVA